MKGEQHAGIGTPNTANHHSALRCVDINRVGSTPPTPMAVGMRTPGQHPLLKNVTSTENHEAGKAPHDEQRKPVDTAFTDIADHEDPGANPQARRPHEGSNNTIERKNPRRVRDLWGAISGQWIALAQTGSLYRRLNTSEPLVPPKPKLFLIATSIRMSLAVLAQ